MSRFCHAPFQGYKKSVHEPCGPPVIKPTYKEAKRNITLIENARKRLWTEKNRGRPARGKERKERAAFGPRQGNRKQRRYQGIGGQYPLLGRTNGKKQKKPATPGPQRRLEHSGVYEVCVGRI
ncbi:hypothetical protein ACF0H5_008285 [Mactra antiquata]